MTSKAVTTAKLRLVKINEVGDLVDVWDSSLPLQFKHDLFELLTEMERLNVQLFKEFKLEVSF